MASARTYCTVERSNIKKYIIEICDKNISTGLFDAFCGGSSGLAQSRYNIRNL